MRAAKQQKRAAPNNITRCRALGQAAALTTAALGSFVCESPDPKLAAAARGAGGDPRWEI
jgi:hypothetical protein